MVPVRGGSRVDEARREEDLCGGGEPDLGRVSGPRALVGGVEGRQLDLHPLALTQAEWREAFTCTLYSTLSTRLGNFTKKFR